MEKMAVKNFENEQEQNISIVERILLKTGNPKLAAVLALDLLLVGVDTVRKKTHIIFSPPTIAIFFLDFYSGCFNTLSAIAKSRKTRAFI